MAIIYPKTVKPWRGYPSSNTIMAIRMRVNQAPVMDPVGMIPLGTIALVKDKAVHIGTIPKGAFVLPASRHVKTVFTAAGTIKIGTKADPEAILKGADSAITTLGVSTGLVGNQTGIAGAELQLFAVLDTAGEVAGEIDIVIPFYIQKD